MLRPIGLIVLLSACTVSAVSADIAPGPRRAVERQPLTSWAMVELRSAQVNISVRRTDPAGSADTSAASAPPTAVAQVECSFELYCTAGEPPRQPYSIAFPVSRWGDPAIQATDLSVQIDSVEIDDITYTEEMSFPPDKGRYRGYRWPAEVRLQRKMHVNVSYVLHLDMSQGPAFFRYVLCSGGTWSAPIGRETVTVHCGNGLAVQPLAAKTLQPKVGSGMITWELRGVRPTEDIELSVRPD